MKRFLALVLVLFVLVGTGSALAIVPPEGFENQRFPIEYYIEGKPHGTFIDDNRRLFAFNVYSRNISGSPREGHNFQLLLENCDVSKGYQYDEILPIPEFGTITVTNFNGFAKISLWRNFRNSSIRLDGEWEILNTDGNYTPVLLKDKNQDLVKEYDPFVERNRVTDISDKFHQVLYWRGNTVIFLTTDGEIHQYFDNGDQLITTMEDLGWKKLD